MNRLTDKVAVVTGSSRGIGAAIAKHLAAEGASVVVNYRSDKASADGVVTNITKDGGRAFAVRADITQPCDVEALFRAALNAFGSLDILVNNAGMYRPASLSAVTQEHLSAIFDLNVFGLIFACKEAIRYFGAGGGNIINVSSIVSKLTPAGTMTYNATKAAVDAITSTLAKELAHRKIRVNSINPGLIETDGLRSSGFMKYVTRQAKGTTRIHIGRPEDVSPVVVFLASEDSRPLTGEIVCLTNM